MAIQGPYYSDLLLLVMYISGLRFSPGMDAKERQVRSGRYMTMVMSMIMDELCKPSNIPTTRMSTAGYRVSAD